MGTRDALLAILARCRGQCFHFDIIINIQEKGHKLAIFVSTNCSFTSQLLLFLFICPVSFSSFTNTNIQSQIVLTVLPCVMNDTIISGNDLR